MLAGHALHALECFWPEYVPAAQMLHSLSVVALPLTLTRYPSAQIVCLAHNVEPACGWYLPRGQTTHASAPKLSAYWPAVHFSHCACPGCACFVPGVQLGQVP